MADPGLSLIRIVAPVPVDREQAEQLAAKFARHCGLAAYEYVVEQDPDLIGGLVVFAGGFRYDYSVKGQLGRIAAQLKSSKPIDFRSFDFDVSSVIRSSLEDSLSQFTETPMAPDGKSDMAAVQPVAVSYAGEEEEGGTLGFRLRKALSRFTASTTVDEIGEVLEAGDGIVRVSGIDNCLSHELVEFENGSFGLAMNLEESTAGVVLLGDPAGVHQGTVCKRTGRTVDVPVGMGLLGRVLDPLGAPLDGQGPLPVSGYRPIESPAPSVVDRQTVDTSLHTGVTAIDALTPIGRGQRELIIGDRQTGKTALAVDAILNQRGKGVYCLYVAIGQKMSTVAAVVNLLRERGAMDYTIVVVASASAPASLQYIAPYAGCAMAEELMLKEKADVLVVYDDLTKHAQAYRAISLLLRRPPGREAYPGDVFYLHSRLLERAARLSASLGGGSMTALPIVETQGGDISAYIPTNVISITDGQIYLETDLFFSGQRPAINVGLSVSRVGGAAQSKAMKKVAGPLRIRLAQYRELEAFSQFGSELDEETREQLRTGACLLEILKQPQGAPIPMEEQVVSLYLATQGVLTPLDREDIQGFLAGYMDFLRSIHPDVLAGIAATGDFGAEAGAVIQAAFAEYHQLWSADRERYGTEG